MSILALLALLGCHHRLTFLGDFTAPNSGYEGGQDYYTFKPDGTYTLATSSPSMGKFYIETGTFKVDKDVVEIISMQQQFLSKDGHVTGRYQGYYGRPILEKKYQFVAKENSFVLHPKFDTDVKEVELTAKK